MKRRVRVHIPSYNDGGEHGGDYTYSGRPEAKYRKEGDKWLINLGESTGNNYVPIKDKDGSRARVLNANAVKSNMSSFIPKEENFKWESAPSMAKKPVDKSNRQQSFDTDFKVDRISAKEKIEADATRVANEATAGLKQKGIKVDQSDWDEMYNSHVEALTPYASRPMQSVVSQGREQDWRERLIDITANPTAAFKYAVSGGGIENMPYNYNAMLNAGSPEPLYWSPTDKGRESINPGAVSFQERFGYGDKGKGSGSNPLDILNDMANPLKWASDIDNSIGEGEYGQAALGLLDFIPGRKALGKAGEFLTTKTALKNAFNLNPKALKEPPSVTMYRTQKPGQTEEIQEALELQKRAKESGIGSLSLTEKIKLSGYQSRPNIGQGFDTDLTKASYYGHPNIRSTRHYTETPEVLRITLPREQAEALNVKNFPEYASQSRAHRTEHIIPIEDILDKSEKFSFDDLDKLKKEQELLNPKPHWLRGYPEVDVHKNAMVSITGTTPKEPPGSPPQSSLSLDAPQGMWPFKKKTHSSPNTEVMQREAFDNAIKFSEDWNMDPTKKTIFENYRKDVLEFEKSVGSFEDSIKNGFDLNDINEVRKLWTTVADYKAANRPKLPIALKEGILDKDVKQKIDEILKSNSGKNTFYAGDYVAGSELIDTPNYLINPEDGHESLSNFPKELQESLVKYKGTANGVNMREGSFTFSTPYTLPSQVSGVTAHEYNHTAQEIKDWGQVISTFDPEYGYYVPNKETEIGRMFADAMVEPNKLKNLGDKHDYQTWLSSPSELHSELGKARFQVYTNYRKSGISHEEAMNYLKNPDDELLDYLLKHGDLEKHFKKTTKRDIKHELLRLMPVAVPAAVAVGTAMSQEQEDKPSTLRPVYANGGIHNAGEKRRVRIAIPSFNDGGKHDGRKGKILTYKDNADYFDSRAVYHDNPTYNDQIKQRIYSGKWGYNPTSGELVKLEGSNQVEVNPNISRMATQSPEQLANEYKVQAAHQQSINDPRYTGKVAVQVPRESSWNPLGEDQAGKTLYMSQDEADQFNKNMVRFNMEQTQKHPLWMLPGTVATGSFGGAQAVRGATNWGLNLMNKPIVAGFSAGEMVAPYYTYKTAESTIDFVKDPSWGGVAEVAWNASSLPAMLTGTVKVGKAIKNIDIKAVKDKIYSKLFK